MSQIVNACFMLCVPVPLAARMDFAKDTLRDRGPIDERNECEKQT